VFCGETIVPERLTGPQLSFNFTIRNIDIGGIKMKSKINININGIPAILFAAIFIIVFIAMVLELVPDNMGGAFAICLVLGVGLMWVGDHTPVLKDYGLGTILTVLIPAFLLYVGIIPQSASDIAKNFFSNYDFTSFLVPGLLVGSILAMNRKTLINAGVRFIIPMIVTVFVASAFSGIVGAILGYGFIDTILYIAGPILGSGISASAVPLSEIYAQYGGGEAESILTTLTASVIVANIVTILIACILSAIGKKNPNFIFNGFAGHDGKILRKAIDIKTTDEEKDDFVKDNNITTFADLQIGFLLTCGIFMLGKIMATNLPGGLHFYLYMIVITVILKVTNILPEEMCSASGAWSNFMAKVLTPCTLCAISLGVLELGTIIDLFSNPIFLVICILCVLVTTIIAGILCYMFGFYFLEGAIMAGLGLADMGGTGDVAVLSAANRMELLPFLTISSRIGGAINMAWLTFLASKFL